MNLVVILYSDFQQLWTVCNKGWSFSRTEISKSLPVPVQSNSDTPVEIIEYLVRKESTFSIFQVISPLNETTLVLKGKSYRKYTKRSLSYTILVVLSMEIFLSMFYVNHRLLIFKPNTTGCIVQVIRLVPWSQTQYTLHRERLNSEKNLLSLFKACYWNTKPKSQETKITY